MPAVIRSWNGNATAPKAEHHHLRTQHVVHHHQSNRQILQNDIQPQRKIVYMRMIPITYRRTGSVTCLWWLSCPVSMVEIGVMP